MGEMCSSLWFVLAQKTAYRTNTFSSVVHLVATPSIEGIKHQHTAFCRGANVGPDIRENVPTVEAKEVSIDINRIRFWCEPPVD